MASWGLLDVMRWYQEMAGSFSPTRQAALLLLGSLPFSPCPLYSLHPALFKDRRRKEEDLHHGEHGLFALAQDSSGLAPRRELVCGLTRRLRAATQTTRFFTRVSTSILFFRAFKVFFRVFF